MNIKKAMVKNIELPGTTESALDVVTASRENGHPLEGTAALKWEGSRECVNHPLVDLFELATNGDGRTEFIDGELEFQNSLGAATIKAEMHDAFVQSYSLYVPADDTKPVTESWTILSGNSTLHANGKTKSHVVPHFKD